MPRHDWRDDDLMSRERSFRDYEDRDSGAFFGGDRDELRMRRRRGLLSDESSGGRRRERSDRHQERSFGPDDDRGGIPRDETERLIASNKVEGTPVYDRNDERLGSIHNFMVDKFRGKVVYAVLKYSSGFLGLDDRYYPLDWDQLTFDTRLGGYRIGLTEEDLKGFGSWDRNERWSGRNRSSPERGGYDRDRDYRRERAMRERDLDRGMMREPW